jgi:hypothetical protein
MPSAVRADPQLMKCDLRTLRQAAAAPIKPL